MIGKLPVRLEPEHKEGQKKFNLHPKDSQFIDVVMWQLVEGRATPELDIRHVEEKVNRIIPILDNKMEYEIRIEVTGKNTPCETRDFKVGMANKDNTFEKIWIQPV